MKTPVRRVFSVWHYFRGATAFVVIGHGQILGVIPVDVDLTVVLVGIKGTSPEARGIFSVHIHWRKQPVVASGNPTLSNESLAASPP